MALEGLRAKLEGLLAQALAIQKEQAATKAAKQEASKRLRGIVTEGRRLANLLRRGVREHFGPRAEKLAEFNLQPFRGRPRLKAKPDPEEPKQPEPSSPSPPSTSETAADDPQVRCAGPHPLGGAMLFDGERLAAQRRRRRSRWHPLRRAAETARAWWPLNLAPAERQEARRRLGRRLVAAAAQGRELREARLSLREIYAVRPSYEQGHLEPQQEETNG